MILEIKNLSTGYPNHQVLHDVSMEIESGEILCLLGPNGVGKTTLFKSVLGFIKPSEGEVLVDGKSLADMSRKEFAAYIAYVPQQHEPPFPFKVLDVVVLGRMPYLGPLSVPKKKDIQIAKEALEAIGISHLADQDYTQISGGERQMVLIARAIAQQPKFLIMDEPTANLDYGNQVKILEQIKSLAAEGMGVILTTHSPDHAFLCSTKVALLCRNNHLDIGTADEIISQEKMEQAYGIVVKVVQTEGIKGETVKGCIPLLNH